MQDETMEVRSERNAGARRRTVDVIIPTYRHTQSEELL